MQNEYGWSQRKLAEKLGCSQSYVRKMVSTTEGETVGLKWVRKATELYELDPEYFFTPGPPDLDPGLYKRSVRRTLAERVARLEQAAGAEPDDGSNVRPITRPPKR